MIGVYVISASEIVWEEAETKEQLKRFLLDTYNVQGYRFSDNDHGDNAKTFNRYFEGVNAGRLA